MHEALDVARFHHDGLVFRDLDHDGILAPFEDWRLSPFERAVDLVGRLSVEEKAGLLLHGTLFADGPFGVVGVGDAYDIDAVTDFLCKRHITSAITRLTPSPREMAKLHNQLQAIAAQTRFSIPLSISTDPRHHFTELRGVSHMSKGFTKFPEFLGLGATDDIDLVRRFGDVVRREYRAIGIHVALSPQADLATEPRWSRALGTFGSNPNRVSRLVGAYVEGVQGGVDGVHAESVACVVKHWVGYGASRDGFDGHNYYGRFSAFPGGRFNDHVDAFSGAFDAHVAGVMPTYNILENLEIDGTPVEQVGAGFSRVLLTKLLRETKKFSGVVLSDWSITRDVTESCRTGEPPQGPQDIAMAWGVEDLSRPERFAAAINAGVDQLGGEDDPAPLLDAISSGLITMDRVDEAAIRVLEQKFRLGLFENPFVDENQAERVVGQADHHALSLSVQRAALVELAGVSRDVLPSDQVYLVGVDRDEAIGEGLDVVDRLDQATIAIVRISAPFERLHPTFFFGSMMHEGSLAYSPDDPRIIQLREIASKVPVIVVVFCDRPPTVGLLDEHASYLIGEYGITDKVLIRTLTDGQKISGRLPMARPVAMDEVFAHSCDQYDGWSTHF
jgi:beta-glucosidase